MEDFPIGFLEVLDEAGFTFSLFYFKLDLPVIRKSATFGNFHLLNGDFPVFSVTSMHILVSQAMKVSCVPMFSTFSLYEAMNSSMIFPAASFVGA